jgi:Rod binding domain-containing protein
MLSAARKSSFGDTITNSSGTGSQGADSFLAMQDSRFADIASQKGAFGLADMIEKQLIRRQAQSGAQPVPAAPKPADPGTGG